jgi:hypothetical protein
MRLLGTLDGEGHKTPVDSGLLVTQRLRMLSVSPELSHCKILESSTDIIKITAI